MHLNDLILIHNKISSRNSCVGISICKPFHFDDPRYFDGDVCEDIIESLLARDVTIVVVESALDDMAGDGDDRFKILCNGGDDGVCGFVEAVNDE